MLRFIFYLILFFILFRIIRSIQGYFYITRNNKTNNDNLPKKKSRFEDVEEAKYIDITSEDEKKN